MNNTPVVGSREPIHSFIWNGFEFVNEKRYAEMYDASWDVMGQRLPEPDGGWRIARQNSSPDASKIEARTDGLHDDHSPLQFQGEHKVVREDAFAALAEMEALKAPDPMAFDDGNVWIDVKRVINWARRIRAGIV